MLTLRANCECCNTDLPPDSLDARICTFECTFCAACAGQKLEGICPNCGGELVRRPRRPAGKLAQYPASVERVYKPAGCANLALKSALYLEPFMQAVLTPLTVGISEFKKNPSATLRKAKGAPVAVLSHNEPSFYVVQPEVMRRLTEGLEDREFTALILSRRASAAKGNMIEVSVDEL